MCEGAKNCKFAIMNKNRESTFRFKHFSLSNSISAMKVGTDGVLLGAWASLPRRVTNANVLDVGCGTGVIGLMIAQRYPGAFVSCIDISEDAVGECDANVKASPFAERIVTQLADFKQFACDKRFDLIVSNPPFFTERVLSPDGLRATARHDDSLPLPELMRRAKSLLADGGILALVLPASRDNEALLEASLAGLAPSRCCRVFTRVGKPSRRTLWEFAASPDTPCVEHDLVIQNSTGDYADEYEELLKDFYLAF